jgi:hypothetical protein
MRNAYRATFAQVGTSHSGVVHAPGAVCAVAGGIYLSQVTIRHSPSPA